MPLVKENLTCSLHPSASLYTRPTELPYYNTLVLQVINVLSTYDAQTIIANIYVCFAQTLSNIVM